MFVDGPVSPEFIATSIQKHNSKTDIGAHQIFLGQIRADEIEGKKVKSNWIHHLQFNGGWSVFRISWNIIWKKHDITCMHVHHSLGTVNAGEINLFVFISSKHRNAATEACKEMVEFIKNKIPVWGKEVLRMMNTSGKKNTWLLAFMIDITQIFHLTICQSQAIVRLSSQSAMDSLLNKTVGKGDVLKWRKAAALLAIKIHSVIPDCHPLPVEYAAVRYFTEGLELRIEVEVKTIYKTGVEVGSHAWCFHCCADCIYDMLKPVDKQIEIASIDCLKRKAAKLIIKKNTEKASPQQLLFAVIRSHPEQRRQSRQGYYS